MNFFLPCGSLIELEPVFENNILSPLHSVNLCYKSGDLYMCESISTLSILFH